LLGPGSLNVWPFLFVPATGFGIAHQVPLHKTSIENARLTNTCEATALGSAKVPSYDSWAVGAARSWMRGHFFGLQLLGNINGPARWAGRSEHQGPSRIDRKKNSHLRFTPESGHFASTRLFRYAIRLLGAWMTQARSAGIGALLPIVTPLGAFVQAGLAVGRHRYGGGGIGVAFGCGYLSFRQTHGSFRSESNGRRQGHQQNTQHKSHGGISLLRPQLFVPTNKSRTRIRQINGTCGLSPKSGFVEQLSILLRPVVESRHCWGQTNARSHCFTQAISGPDSYSVRSRTLDLSAT